MPLILNEMDKGFMGVKKLFFDDGRTDVSVDGQYTPDDIVSAADKAYTKYRNARIDEIFQHGERTKKFYGQRSMNDVLKMFNTLPFDALNVMVKDYIAGVHEIKALDTRRAKHISDNNETEQKFG